MTRTCIECESTLPIDEFPRNGKSYRTRCSECYRVYNTQNKRSVYKTDYNRRHMLMKKYGLTIEMYEEILAAQGGVCAVCKSEELTIGRGGFAKALSVDHNHGCCPGPTSCGSCIRGLLCQKCNTLLGYASDDPGVLRAAAEYLEEKF